MNGVSEAYTFSIIIPTFNGRNKITHSLDSILGSKYDFEYEIIIVVDGSTDDTLAVLAPYRNEDVKIIFQENKGRAVARNKGVQEATGEYLVFLDDDMRLSRNCLNLHLAHHQAFPNTVLVGNVSLDHSKFSKEFDFYVSHLYDKWELGYANKTLLRSENLKFTTQHVSIKGIIFDSINGFDNRLTDAEDYDLAMRLLEAKIEIYYDPTIVTWHDDFPSLSKYIKRQIEYRLSHQRLIELGKKYEFGVFQPIEKPAGGAKQLFLKIFSKSIWVNWVEKEMFVFLPEKIRFKLYATVIYAHTLKGLRLI